MQIRGFNEDREDEHPDHTAAESTDWSRCGIFASAHNIEVFKFDDPFSNKLLFSVAC